MSPDETDLSDLQRAESEWLLTRQSDRAAVPPSPTIARDYDEIEELLASMPVGGADPAWQAEVFRLASRRKTIRRTLGGAVVIAGAAAAAVLLVPRTPAELEVAVRPDDTRGGPGQGLRSHPSEAAVGDHLVITARPRGRGDLRVYGPGGKLVSKCPGGPSCASATQDEYVIDVSLDAPVRYHVVLAIGSVDAPIGATMDEYLDAARAANARLVLYPPLDVH